MTTSIECEMRSGSQESLRPRNPPDGSTVSSGDITAEFKELSLQQGLPDQSREENDGCAVISGLVVSDKLPPDESTIREGDGSKNTNSEKKEKTKTNDEDEDEDDEEEDKKDQEFTAPFVEKIKHAMKETIEEVEIVRGGGFNGIIKVKMKSSEGIIPRYAIYRIPKDWNPLSESFQSIRDTAALHSFLCDEHRLNFHVPKVLEYDTTANNFLQHPYTLMEYVNGSCLLDVYEYLPLGAKLQIAEQVAAIIYKLGQISFEKAGRLVAADGIPNSMRLGDNNAGACGGSIKTAVKITGFGVRDFDDVPTMNDPAENTKELFSTQVKSWQRIERAYMKKKKLKKPTKLLKRWKEMERILREIDKLGFLDEVRENKNVLHHWDLHARNILVQLDPEMKLGENIPEEVSSKFVYFDPRIEVPGTWIKIVAMLDWDDMYSLPAILTRSPPFWLWDWGAPRELTSSNQKNGKRICKSQADLFPLARWKADIGILSEHDRYVKEQFDTKIDEWMPGYYEDSYCPRGRLLRRFWRIVMDGLFYVSNADMQTTLVSDFDAAHEYLKKKQEKKHGKKVDDAEKNAIAMNGPTDAVLEAAVKMLGMQICSRSIVLQESPW